MTRINCVPVESLVRQHLIAEYRELPRVFALARPTATIPSCYTLGRGHVTFFYNKLQWLTDRYYAIVDEMKKRGYTVNYPDPPKGNPNLYGNWEPMARDMEINQARINERLRGMNV